MYERKTKTYNGLSETDVSNFNKALKDAQRAVLNAYINFDRFWYFLLEKNKKQVSV